MRILACLATAFAVCVSVPAAGQRLLSDQASKKEQVPEQLTVTASRQMLAEFATCLVRKHRIKIRELVLREGWAYPEEYHAIADKACMRGSAERLDKDVLLRMSPALLGYATAEALFKDEVKTFSRSQIDNARPLVHPQLELGERRPESGKNYTPEQLAQMEQATSLNLGTIAFARFGECVVRADPDASAALLNTPVGSPEERAAIGSLGGAMSGCVQDGVKFSLTPAMVRGTVADSLLSLVNAPRIETLSTGSSAKAVEALN